MAVCAPKRSFRDPMFLLRKVVADGGFNPFLTPLPSCKNEVQNSQGEAVLRCLVLRGGATHSPILVRRLGGFAKEEHFVKSEQARPHGTHHPLPVRGTGQEPVVEQRGGYPCQGSSEGELWVLACFSYWEIKPGKEISAWF